MKGENQLLQAYLHEMPCCLYVTGEDAYAFLQSQFSNDLPKNGVSIRLLWFMAERKRSSFSR